MTITVPYSQYTIEIIERNQIDHEITQVHLYK